MCTLKPNDCQHEERRISRRRLTSCSAQSATASFALEVFGFLMIDENLQVIEIALTVVAPWSGEDLIQVGMVALLFGHRDLFLCLWWMQSMTGSDTMRLKYG